MSVPRRLVAALLIVCTWGLAWVWGVKRWPPTEQVVAWAKGRPTRPQLRESILLDVRSSDVVFVGDSITAEGLWNEYFTPNITVANRGFPGATTADLLTALPAITSPRGNLYLLMAGINDILYAPWGPQQTAANLLALRQQLKEAVPYTRVIIQSTLECSPPHCTTQALKAIRNINQTLLTSLPSEEYLDINTVLSSSSGLRREYTFDGIHLNAVGYRRWRELLTNGPIGKLEYE